MAEVLGLTVWAFWGYLDDDPNSLPVLIFYKSVFMLNYEIPTH